MKLELHSVIYAGILILPTFIDGIVQYVFHIESTNIRRVILGCISGAGLWILASWMDEFCLSAVKRMFFYFLETE